MRNVQSLAVKRALAVFMLLLVGCGQQRVVDVEKPAPLTDDGVRAILEEVVKTGDTGGAEVVRVYHQFMDAGPDRANYHEINNRLAQMVVNSSPDQNQDLAKKVLELW